MALSIFAVLSVLAYSGLKAMVASRQQVEQEAERLASLQMAITRLTRDVAQAVPRPIRGESGHELPALASDAGGNLEFTRGGWRNPARRPRSNFQRVAYRLTGGELLRQSWPFLDRAPGQEPFSELLLGRVSSFQVRFLNSTGSWLEQWPPEGEPVVLPRAAEISLELEDLGRIRRLVVL